MSVSVTVEIRDASAIEIGTVYGPPPTRIAGGGLIVTCADPIPGVVVGVAGYAGVPAGGAAGAAG